MLAGCAAPDEASAPASPDPSAVRGSGSAAPAGDQLASGAEFYAASCASCHGTDGEGDIGPALVGENYAFRSRGTAQGLYDYVSDAMPFDAPGSLPEQEYWDILAWILDQNELLPEGTQLGPENAADVNVNP
ncbi:MAG: c-type cytochrome [Chloroflexi bacterium]|nr:c-type cytochrome [Chloroflexota bacterium]